MLESGYDVLFGKLALHCLFEDYFQPVRHFSTKIMLKPIDDPLVDLVANVSGEVPFSLSFSFFFFLVLPKSS